MIKGCYLPRKLLIYLTPSQLLVFCRSGEMTYVVGDVDFRTKKEYANAMRRFRSAAPFIGIRNRRLVKALFNRVLNVVRIPFGELRTPFGEGRNIYTAMVFFESHLFDRRLLAAVMEHAQNPRSTFFEECKIALPKVSRCVRNLPRDRDRLKTVDVPEKLSMVYQRFLEQERSGLTLRKRRGGKKGPASGRKRGQRPR